MKGRGFVLTVDAIIAMMFVLAIFIALSAYRFTNTTETTTSAFINLHHISEDVLDVLNKQGVLDQIGEEWTVGNESGAANLSGQYLDEIIPPNMGYRLLFDDQTVTENTRVSEDDAIAKTHSMRLLAGYEKNKTTIGSVARTFLTGITEKTNSVYAYFGGFVGQGDITKYLRVPNGVTIVSAYMEMDAGSSFDMYVNGQGCNNPHNPSGGYLSADIKEDISNCGFTTGTNTIGIEFGGGPSEEQFIGGGFIRVTYNTSIMNETGLTGSDTYEFPGIEGFINYYSSFYIPGTLNSMGIHLEFDNNYTTFLRIGDVLIYNSSGSSNPQVVDLDDSYLQGKLNYNSLSGKTVPLRLGTVPFTQIGEVGNADVILITDLSGSMMWRIGYPSGDGVVRNCSNGLLLANNTRRISLAKCLDKDFVNIILNGTGNRVGLVGFNDDADRRHDLSTDINSLTSHINNYPNNPSGGTCICCAINRAYDMLNSQSQPGRDRYIIVMSDGITGYCCGTSGWWWWASCDSQGTSTSGRYNDCGGNPSDCTGNQCNGAIANAIWSAQRVHDNLGATINSVGFGPVADCYNGNYTLQQIAVAGNGSYCASTNATELQDCYVRLASQIVQMSNRSQVVNLTGNVTPSTLYPTSYITYNYSPIVPSLGYGEIALTYDTNRFNDNITCLGTFFIPSDVGVIDGKATSYSSEHWTHYLHIYNSQGTRVSYRLSDYGDEYFILGDPYIVQIRPDYVESGENNTIRLTTGDEGDNETGCSLDNRAILTIKMSGSTSYGGVFPKSEGCNWDIEFEDGSTSYGPIPSSYTGSSECSYTLGNISQPTQDAANDAIYRLLLRLDLDDDGQIDIKFDPNQVDFDLSQVGGVRSLWGPAQLKLVVWI
jgi:hypothetical protein